MLTQIAAVLKVSIESIKSVTEWQKVYFVQFNSGRPTFVSKKAVNNVPSIISYNYPTGQKVEMRFVGQVNFSWQMPQQMYEIFVDGRFHSKQTVLEVLKSLSAMTEAQKQEFCLVVA